MHLTSVELVIDIVLYKALNSLNGLANTADMTEGLTTTLSLQKPPVTDLSGQSTRMVLALRMTLIVTQVVHIFHAFMELEYSLLFS
jgi:hypothetical protein